MANKAEIKKLQDGATTDLDVLAKQQEAAARRIGIALEQARASAQSYVDTIARQNDREIAGMGAGALQRSINDRIGQREDQFQGRKDQLDAQLRAKQITDSEYTSTLAVEKAAHEQLLAADQKYWTQKLEKQKEWKVGALDALQDYYDQSKDIASQFQETVSNALKGLEDQLTNLFTGKKFDASALLGSIGADLARSFTKENITGPLSQTISNALKGSSGSIFGSLFGNSSGLIGTAAGATGAASASTTALAGSAATATAALTALAAASTAAAAAMVGGNIGSALSAANAVGSSGGDALGALIGLMRWSDGGYTGDGGKYQPAGIVHAGEGVLSQEDIAALGGEGGFNSLRRLLRNGYSDGGYVKPLPSAIYGGAAPSRSAPTVVLSTSPTINVDSRSDRAAVIADVQRVVSSNNEQLIREFQRMGIIPQGSR